MNSSTPYDQCKGYLSSPQAVKESYCAMRNCYDNLLVTINCCTAAADTATAGTSAAGNETAGKEAKIFPYGMVPADHRNNTWDLELNGIYCLIGHYSFSQWEKCTSSQGVEAGICAIGVETYASGAGREGPESLMGVLGLLMVLRAMLW